MPELRGAWACREGLGTAGQGRGVRARQQIAEATTCSAMHSTARRGGALSGLPPIRLPTNPTAKALWATGRAATGFCGSPTARTRLWAVDFVGRP